MEITLLIMENPGKIMELCFWISVGILYYVKKLQGVLFQFPEILSLLLYTYVFQAPTNTLLDNAEKWGVKIVTLEGKK